MHQLVRRQLQAVNGSTRAWKPPSGRGEKIKLTDVRMDYYTERTKLIQLTEKSQLITELGKYLLPTYAVMNFRIRD